MGISLAVGIALALVQAGPPSDGDYECPGMTTYDMNMCVGQDLVMAEERLARYIDVARAHWDRSPFLEIIDRTQAAWASYAESECKGVREQFRGGSILGLISGNCRRILVDERTHTIWRHWLQLGGDSTPPILPEPEPTRDSNGPPESGNELD